MNPQYIFFYQELTWTFIARKVKCQWSNLWLQFELIVIWALCTSSGNAMENLTKLLINFLSTQVDWKHLAQWPSQWTWKVKWANVMINNALKTPSIFYVLPLLLNFQVIMNFVWKFFSKSKLCHGLNVNSLPCFPFLHSRHSSRSSKSLYWLEVAH